MLKLYADSLHFNQFCSFMKHEQLPMIKMQSTELNFFFNTQIVKPCLVSQCILSEVLKPRLKQKHNNNNGHIE